MKALSLHPEWAYDIAEGTKTKEYRSWSTNHRGDLAICATAAKNKDDRNFVCGHVICVVDLYDVKKEDEGYVWHLRNLRYVDPLPVKGKQRLFDFDTDLQEIVNLDGNKLTFNNVIGYWIELGLISEDA